MSRYAVFADLQFLVEVNSIVSTSKLVSLAILGRHML